MTPRSWAELRRTWAEIREERLSRMTPDERAAHERRVQEIIAAWELRESGPEEEDPA